MVGQFAFSRQVPKSRGAKEELEPGLLLAFAGRGGRVGSFSFMRSRKVGVLLLDWSLEAF